MSDLDYHTLNDLVQMTGLGDAGPGKQIVITNMSGDASHLIDWKKHCEKIAQKHNTDLVKLFSVMLQKSNGDMIIRLRRAEPVFKDKLNSVIQEWNTPNISPNDLFECPETCYDYNNLTSLEERVKSYDDIFSSINDNMKKENFNAYDDMVSLRDKYHSCDEDIQQNLVEIETRMNEYEPKYRSILCDLATKHKPFYLSDTLLGDDEERSNMIHHVNKKMNRHIPDNIHVIFLNLVIIPTLIQKELENYKHRFIVMKDDIESKQNKLQDFIRRVEPGSPTSSFGLLKILSDLLGSDEDPLKDDDDSSDEENTRDNLEETMQKIVDKSQDGEKLIIQDDEDTIPKGEPNKIYDLIISDNEDNDEDNDIQDRMSEASFY